MSGAHDSLLELLGAPRFADRRDAGRLLAEALAEQVERWAAVVGLARGGIAVAAEVAHVLRVPLDVVAVRKVGHPWAPEYAIGAVTPGDGVYVRARDGLTDEQVDAAVGVAQAAARELDRRLHHECAPLDLEGRTCALVDDGLATGATMVAAVRWAKSRGAARVVAAVPVAAAESAALVRAEADSLVALHEPEPFFAVGIWYQEFGQVGDAEVAALLHASRRSSAAADPATSPTA